MSEKTSKEEIEAAYERGRQGAMAEALAALGVGKSLKRRMHVDWDLTVKADEESTALSADLVSWTSRSGGSAIRPTDLCIEGEPEDQDLMFRKVGKQVEVYFKEDKVCNAVVSSLDPNGTCTLSPSGSITITSEMESLCDSVEREH